MNSSTNVLSDFSKHFTQGFLFQISLPHFDAIILVLINVFSGQIGVYYFRFVLGSPDGFVYTIKPTGPHYSYHDKVPM